MEATPALAGRAVPLGAGFPGRCPGLMCQHALGVQNVQAPLPEPKRCRAPLATALQSGLPERARQTLSLAPRADTVVKLCCLWVLTQTILVAPCRGATVTWVGGSGDWGDTNKWSGGATPGQNDDAVIDTSNGAITVTISSETVQVNSLLCEETLLLNGGTILGGTVTTANGGVLVVQSGTLDGVTVNGVLDVVGSDNTGANLTVVDGLVLNGTANVGGDNGLGGAISFAGNQVLSGSGTVVFGSYFNPSGNALRLANSGTTLVIGSGITVRGQNGTLGYTGSYGGPQDVSVVNQGTISADVSGGKITIDGQPFSNQGVVESPAGTLNLAGTLGPGGLGNIESGNGLLILSGTLTNTGETLVLDGATNMLTLSGGTISGGTITTTNGAALIVQSGTLDGVTVNGVLDVVGSDNTGANLTVVDGLVLNGTANVGGDNGLGGAISFAGNQALSGSGTVVFGSYFNPSANALRLANSGTTLVIGSGITVRGQNGTLGYTGSYGGPQDVSVVNQGTISADVSGGKITIDGQPFSNQGVVESPAGTLNLAGTLGPGGLGNIESGNGLLILSGMLTNTGETLVLDGATNMLTLSGGTISGGAITTTNGAALIVQGGTLDGVTFNGVLDVGNTYSGANLTVANGLVLDGTALVGNPTNSNYGAISFAGNQVLSGNGTLAFGGNGSWGDSANALLVGNGGTTLVLGPGITVRGQNGTIGATGYPWYSPANVSVVNQGTISADVSGGRIIVNAQPFSNQGLVMSPAGTLSLAGTVSGLGTFQSGEGLLALSGVLTNAGHTLTLNGSTNVLTLGGGTILGGAISTANGASFIVQSGTLDGVTFNGVLDVGNTYSGANLTVANGLVLDGTALVGNPTNSNYGAISFAGNQVLSGNGTLAFGGNGSWGDSANALLVGNGGTTLVLGPGITVRGQNGTIGATGYPWYSPANVSVVNQGTISADVSGGGS